MTTQTKATLPVCLTILLAACGGKDQQDIGEDGMPAAPASTTTGPSPTAAPTTTPTSAPTTTPTSAPTTTPTTAPTSTPPGARSVTIKTDFIDVPIGGETFKCQNFANPIGRDVDILHSESTMTPGSHHMFAFREQGLGNGSLVDCGGLEFTESIHSAQTPKQVLSYPPGVGRFFPGSDGIRILAHYLNATSAPLRAQVEITLSYVDTDQVQAHAAQIFLNNLALRVRPGQSTASRSFTVPYDIKLLGGVSHMHRHAVGFTSSTSDGQVIYEGTDWNEPTEATFDPPLEISAGTSITWSCTYNNTTNTTLTFGESAATNEMCIFSGTFYPAPGGTGLSSLF